MGTFQCTLGNVGNRTATFLLLLTDNLSQMIKRSATVFEVFYDHFEEYIRFKQIEMENVRFRAPAFDDKVETNSVGDHHQPRLRDLQQLNY